MLGSKGILTPVSYIWMNIQYFLYKCKKSKIMQINLNISVINTCQYL